MKVSITNCALCLCICTQLMCDPAALAQAADPGAQPPQTSGNLDLSSQEKSYNAHIQDSVVIQVGSNNQTVNPNDLLTAAEFVAVRQVVKTGSQFIQLDALGTAVGGSFRITPGLLQHTESLLVPTGVTALYDAGKSAGFNLAGNLTNAGQILTYSSNQAVNTATINTLNTFNQPGALISSNGNLANSYGVNNVVSQLNMTFNSVQNIVNAGQIVSSGSLSMTAVGQIVNALPVNVTGHTPVMQAMQNVNLTANTIINSGTITSTLNNIQIASQLMNDLNVINSNGLMSALAGSINFRDSTFSALANLSVTGGDMTAQQLNFHSGSGLVELNVNDLVGTVNVQACETHVNAATANLVLGNIDLTGDPSFINTAGNVTLGSSMLFSGQSLSIIASGDVTTTASNLTIDTSSSSASGGNILIVAGANLSSDGTTLTISPSALPTGGSASGGKVDFAASPLLTLTSRGLGAGTSNGGKITLVAYAGSGANAGTISLPTGNALTIRSGGSNTGSNGNVTIIAGANRGTGNSISLGSVNTTGGTNGTGQVTLSTSTPTISGGNILVNIASGAASGGTFTTGAVQSASILANNITTTGANITVSAGANATVGALTLLGDRTPGLLNPTIQVDVNQVTDTATAFVVGGPSVCTNCAPSGMSASASSGGTNGNAGTVSIGNFGTGGIKVTNAALLSVPVLTLNGTGGTIILDAAAGATAGTVDLAGGTYAVDGVGSGAGGKFDVRGSVLTNTANTTAWTFSAKGGNGGGAGGQVSLTTTANTGSLAFGTAVRQITALNVQSGTGGGDGGTVNLSAGQDLLIATSRVNSRPQGLNGKGPTFNLKAGTAGAGLLQITGALNTNGAGSSAGGTVNIEYRDAVNPFVVGSTVSASGVSGSITADAPGSGTGGTINISNSASAPLAVELAGTLSAASSTGTRGTLNFTQASSDVIISGAGSLSGLFNAGGRSISISTGAGDLIAGTVASSNGGVTLAANAGNLILTTNVAATGGDLSLTSAPTGSVTVSTGTTASGASVSVQSGTVNIDGQLTSNTGNVSVQSNKADKSLNVLLASGSSISALGSAGNLLFNQLLAGAVSVSGGAQSTSGSINLNGGNAAASLSSNSTTGTINANGSSVSINASTGNLSAGTITTTSGNVSLTAAGGDIALTGDITAIGGGLLLTTAPAGAVTQSSGTHASADSVSISSSSIDLQGLLSAELGNVTIQSNRADHSLSVDMAADSSISAFGPGANILFNSTNSGAISVSGGMLSASGSLDLNGGADAVNLSLDSIYGTTSVNGSTVAVTANSGQLVTGTVSAASGNIALTATAGSIYLTDNVTATGGNVELTSSSNGTVNQSAGKSVSGNSVLISSSSLLIDGSISAAAGNFSTQSNAADRSLAVLLGAGASMSSSANLTFNAAAAGKVSVAGSNGSLSAGNDVKFNGGTATVEVDLAAVSGKVYSNGTSISISTSSGGLTISDTTATSGSITVHTNGDALSPLRVADHATLRATEGNVELVDTNSIAGAIVVGQGASISAVSTGTTLGRVNLAIGAVPASPLAGTAPANVHQTLSNGGTVYWGNGITASLPTNEVSSNGGRVVFSSGGPSSGAITLSGNVYISSTAVNDAPPPMILIASLDFTDPSVVSMILNLQSQGKVGGTLQVSHGVAVGGNAIISSALLAPALTAKNLPVNVTLTMQGFDTSTPINISLTNESSTKQVRINGTEQFVGLSSPSNAFISITSNQSEPVLVIGKTGSITSDGGLTIAASGDIEIGGPLTAFNLAISTIARNGDIRINANVSAHSALSLTAHGSGDIRFSSGLLSASNVTLASHTGNIGSSNRYIQTIAQNLSANTGGNGNVYIKDFVNVNLLSSSAGEHFTLKALGDLNLTGGLSAKFIEITADSTVGNITISSNLTASTEASLETTGSGAIEYAGGTLSTDKLLLQSQRGYIGTNAAPIRVAASELTAKAGGNVFLSAVGNIELADSQSGGAFTLTSTGGITAENILTRHGSITLTAGAGTLKILNGSLLFANEGNIILQNTNLAGGKIEIGTNALIWAYTECNPSLGNVALSIGAVPSAPITGKRPSGVSVVSVAGGKVYFGTNGISAGKNISLLALARDIVFSTGSRSASAITLGNGVTIIADPPIPAAPSAISTIFESTMNAVETRSSTTIQELPGVRALTLTGRDNILPISIQPSSYRSLTSADHRKTLDTTGATISSPEPLSKDSNLQQIAFLQQSTPTAAMMMYTTGALTERTLVGDYDRSAMMEEAPGVFRLTEGETLLSASHPAVLKLSNCDVSIAAGTHVLLNHERALVRIHNIYERSAHSIKIDLRNGQTLALSVGEEVMIGESADLIQAALSESSTARRRTKSFQVQGGKTICRSEASLITALKENRLLRSLVNSSNEKDRAFTSKLVKMAACLMISTQSHGIYKSTK